MKPYLDGLLGYYPKANDFIDESYFCKWGYVINFETDQFDILKGDQLDGDREPAYQESSSAVNSYNGEDRPYISCTIEKSYDLGNLPSDEQFLKNLEEFR